jgi:proteasome lid subunit RPN8/RPN11
MLRLAYTAYQRMIGHCLDGLPLEACGLLAGHADTANATTAYPTGNESASAKVYRIPSKDLLRADRDAEANGTELIGVFHSHTHTDPYPSPTDIENAPDPGWHYVIVSLRDTAPMVRSYRIVDGAVTEEPVVVEGR